MHLYSYISGSTSKPRQLIVYMIRQLIVPFVKLTQGPFTRAKISNIAVYSAVLTKLRKLVGKTCK